MGSLQWPNTLSDPGIWESTTSAWFRKYIKRCTSKWGVFRALRQKAKNNKPTENEAETSGTHSQDENYIKSGSPEGIFRTSESIQKSSRKSSFSWLFELSIKCHFFTLSAIQFPRFLKLKKRRENFRGDWTKKSLFDGQFISKTYGFGESDLIQISTWLGTHSPRRTS